MALFSSFSSSLAAVFSSAAPSSPLASSSGRAARTQVRGPHSLLRASLHWDGQALSACPWRPVSPEMRLSSLPFGTFVRFSALALQPSPSFEGVGERFDE